MELLEQCQKWNENDEFQKIIDALEAIPAGERTPELDSELARAYNNLAQPGDRELFEKAIALLEPHEEYFQGDHCWNFRMGYAYYYLDQEGPALRYFEKALKARPGDKDTQEYINDCRRRLRRTSGRGRWKRGQPLLRSRRNCGPSWTPISCGNGARRSWKNAAGR